MPQRHVQIHVRVPTPKPGMVPESPQTRQRQKRMPPKHCMNLVFSLKKLKFSGRCYANDPQGSSMRDAN